jgi:Na+-translocating ferredoxin:NAD+ oxidoreductase RnfE subunit
MTLKGASFSSYQLQHPGDSGLTSAIFKLNGNASRFTAKAGIDQSLHPDVALGAGATVRIAISGDGRELYQSGLIDRITPLLDIDVDLKGVNELLLLWMIMRWGCI